VRAAPLSDHESRRDEDGELAELHLFRLVVVTGGAQVDQPHLPGVVLDLRPVMQVHCVLDRQLMQAEDVADPSQFPRLGLEQSQPHKAAPGGPAGRLRRGHQALTGPVAVLVVSTVDDHRGLLMSLSESAVRQTRVVAAGG